MLNNDSYILSQYLQDYIERERLNFLEERLGLSQDDKN
jgi:hypothetical protein